MHEITGNRDEVMQLMKDTINKLGADTPQQKKVGARALSVQPAKPPKERDQILETLKKGFNEEQVKKTAKAASATVPQERAVEGWYAPRNQAVALFQSAMDEHLDELGRAQDDGQKSKKTVSLSATKAKKPKGSINDFYKGGGPQKPKKGGKVKAAAVTAAELVQYSNLDPHWAEVVWEKAKLLLKGKHKFTTHKSGEDFRFTMKDKTTIAIVGDWGGGNDAAQAVAERIRKINPDHIIHLGDVYYAGTEKEIRERFLKYWPTPSAGGYSFALNSNHEMYSGGFGYFDVTLKEFKQPASYFSLSNSNWRLIGLDTGYVDHDLNNEQVDWLTAQFKGSKNPRTILLSHHQLFSAYENTDASHLQSRVQPFLDANKIYGWIWGHEHLCVVYEQHMGIKAVCLGNGCFPYNAPSKAKTKVPVKWINNRQSGTSDYKGSHTFALLSIDADKIDIQYIDEDGTVAFKDSWS